MKIGDRKSWRIPAIGIAGGLLFGILDALIYANSLAQHLYAVYRPIARTSVNALLGLTLDCTSGIVMAFLFVALKPAFAPGWIPQGIAFGLVAWFFRVAMESASQAVMFQVPASVLLYGLFAGLAEMLLLGLFYAALLGRR